MLPLRSSKTAIFDACSVRAAAVMSSREYTSKVGSIWQGGVSNSGRHDRGLAARGGGRGGGEILNP